jgi:predicted porin
MKKKLLAIAVSAAMAPAIALADGPTVYGTVNLSLDKAGPTNQLDIDIANDDVDFDGRVRSGWELNTNMSHIGVRGGADLDVANLRGFYQLEYQVDPSVGGNGLLSRDTFIGLEGDFGSVKAGTFSTPTRELSRMVDQFADMAYADLYNVLPGELRLNNMLQYTSPKIAEMLTINVATVALRNGNVSAEGDNEDTLFDTLSISLVADLGDFYAGLGYDKNVGTNVPGGNLLIDNQIGPFGLDTIGIASMDIIRFVAGARMDALEIGFLYQVASSNLEEDNGFTETQEDLEDTTMALSVGFHLNDQIKLKAQYANTDGDQFDTDMTMTTLGADYKLGRNTTAYGYFSRVEISDLDDLDGVDSERLDQVYGVGIKHRF